MDEIRTDLIFKIFTQHSIICRILSSIVFYLMSYSIFCRILSYVVFYLIVFYLNDSILFHSIFFILSYVGIPCNISHPILLQYKPPLDLLQYKVPRLYFQNIYFKHLYFNFFTFNEFTSSILYRILLNSNGLKTR